MYPSITNGESSQGWAVGPGGAFCIPDLLSPKATSSSLDHPLSPSLKVFESWVSVVMRKGILSSIPPSVMHCYRV